MKPSSAADIRMVLAKTTEVSPSTAGRRTIQSPPATAPIPTVPTIAASACGPRPKTLSAKPGSISMKPRVPSEVTAMSISMAPMPPWRAA